MLYIASSTEFTFSTVLCWYLAGYDIACFKTFNTLSDFYNNTNILMSKYHWWEIGKCIMPNMYIRTANARRFNLDQQVSRARMSRLRHVRVEHMSRAFFRFDNCFHRVYPPN